MHLTFFDTYIHKNNIIKILIFLLILFPIMMVLVNYAFELSNYPVSFMESQLSFSGEEIRSHYEQMTNSDIQQYIYAQLVDYVYIIVYGSLTFFLGLYIGRQLFIASKIRFSAYIIGLGGLTAGCCDAIENIFIILMATRPNDFPNIFAILHSIFASIKFALLGIFIIGVVLILTIIIYRKIRR
ncbi:hypothetical protein B6U98_00090 [Thermoplasmatales archaeon ex4572_165]|nr:MAG: hypothetical protein B6U98_00090 [Thermoplasmatales archaeon ex4572_165]